MTAFQERRVNIRMDGWMRESEDRGEETKIQVYPNLVQTGVNIDLLIRELTVKNTHI